MEIFTIILVCADGRRIFGVYCRIEQKFPFKLVPSFEGNYWNQVGHHGAKSDPERIPGNPCSITWRARWSRWCAAAASARTTTSTIVMVPPPQPGRASTRGTRASAERSRHRPPTAEVVASPYWAEIGRGRFGIVLQAQRIADGEVSASPCPMHCEGLPSA